MVLAKVSKLTLLQEREKAIEVVQQQARGYTVKCWLPRSQIQYLRKLGKDPDGQREIVVEIPTWLADTKQLDYD